MLLQIARNIGRRRIHCRDHITCIGIIQWCKRIVIYALIMNQTIRIFPMEELGHLVDILTAKGFISTGPNQDTSMILISLIHAVRTI